jgi:uncharacterized repeat protein (TIGR02543 family)
MKWMWSVLIAGLLVAPAWATNYYLAPASASPAGNDSNNGLDAAHPWLSPNHSLNCGDVILAAAGNYNSANFWNAQWGTVSCPAKNNVAWLKCATFDTCKISASSQAGMFVSASFWGVQGWEITTSGGSSPCINIAPAYWGPSGTIQIDHIILANNVANGCDGDGFNSGNGFGTSVGTDYVAYLGNAVYDTGHNFCAAGMSFWAPVASDTLSGTHYYMAGNIAWNNHSNCGDAEGIILDTLDGVEAGNTPIPYAQQVVATNNISIWNDGPGMQVDLNMNGTPNVHAPVFMTHNTLVNNGVGTSDSSYCAQLVVGTTVNTQTGGNLSATYQHYCFGGSSVLSYAEAFAYAPSSTNHISGDYAYSSFGNSVGSIASTGAVIGSNTTSPDPAFPSGSTSKPGAPACTGKASVPDCMSTVIANFTPTASAALSYGYQAPSSISVTDALYPQWLCGVTNLPSGLVTPGCGAPTYALTVTAPTNGTITGTNCATGTYTSGTSVSCTATPSGGYSFSGWSGACAGTGTCSLALNANSTIAATFAPVTYSLAVTAPAHGTISGTNCTAGSYAGGTAVSCTAAPSTGYSFTGWSGACTGTGACSFTLSANSTVTASFSAITSGSGTTITGPFVITITGSGTVTIH